MVWQLDIRLYKNVNLHVNTHYAHCHAMLIVNINNFRTNYNNDNTLHS